jgi:hypothetical protein
MTGIGWNGPSDRNAGAVRAFVGTLDGVCLHAADKYCALFAGFSRHYHQVLNTLVRQRL